MNEERTPRPDTMIADRLDQLGPEALRDDELLALVLRCEPEKARGIDVLDLMRDGVAAMVKRYGIGPAKAQTLVAARELVRRCDARPNAAVDLSGPRQVWDFLADLRSKTKEHFIALYVNARNRLIQRETVSIGTLTASLVHPREVFGPACERAAAGIIVAHNHPSGDAHPSPEDRAATSRLEKAGRILGIPLLDHVIIAREGFYSFREQGGLSA